jgi:hypothetical protein
MGSAAGWACSSAESTIGTISASLAAEALRGFKAGEVAGVFPERDTFCVIWVVWSEETVVSIPGEAVFGSEKEIRLVIL